MGINQHLGIRTESSSDKSWSYHLCIRSFLKAIGLNIWVCMRTLVFQREFSSKEIGPSTSSSKNWKAMDAICQKYVGGASQHIAFTSGALEHALQNMFTVFSADELLANMLPSVVAHYG